VLYLATKSDIVREAIALAPQLFRWERFSYLGLTFLTACVVIFVGFEAITKPGASLSSASLMFGSAGIVTFNIARLLTMFNVILESVFVSSAIVAPQGRSHGN
jgi:hypothetical protein